MLASVIYNLDRRFVPVYYSGCMFVLFLYRKNRTNIQPLQYTGTKRLSRLYITEASIHTRYKNRTNNQTDKQPLQYTGTKLLSNRRS
jgi:hypothetical protein